MNEVCAPRCETRSATPVAAGWKWFGLALWAVPLLAISVIVILRPEHRAVTPLYHTAVAHWWARQPLYDGPAGMNYLPQFALLFSLFHALPLALGETLWRWAAVGGLTWGLWRFVREETAAPKVFALVSLVAMPLTLGALRNGQANAHLGACLLLSASFLRSERWWPASLFLLLALAIKPLAVAAMGLAFAAFPGLWWRLAVGTVGLVAAPFLTGPWDYVAGQYASAWADLRECAAVTQHRFADLNGLLRTVGFPLTGGVSLAVRALAGALFFAGCWRAGRQRDSRLALLWLGAAAAYLMLFNPMTEGNSYVVLAPALGLWAWQLTRSGEWCQAQAVAAMALTMGLLPELLRHWFGNAFSLAWHPAMTLLFVVLLALQTWRDHDCSSNRPAV
jgi:alpha-1,2-mannosyltransferase